MSVKLELPSQKAAKAAGLVIGFLLVALFVIAVGVLIWLAGQRSARNAAAAAQLQVTEQSAEISRETGNTVAAEQAETWRAAQADEGVIRAHIDAQPRAAGRADPDVLRVAREAHARAVCAEGRMHGTCGGNDAATSPE